MRPVRDAQILFHRTNSATKSASTSSHDPDYANHANDSINEMSNSVPRYLKDPKSIVKTCLLRQSPSDPPEVQWIRFREARHPDISKRNKDRDLYCRQPGHFKFYDETAEDITKGKIRAAMALLVGEATIEEVVSTKHTPLSATVDILCSTLLAEMNPLQAYREALMPYKDCRGISLPEDTLKFAQKGSALLLDWLLRSSLGSESEREDLRILSNRASSAPTIPSNITTTLRNQSLPDKSQSPILKPNRNLRLICSKDPLSSEEQSSEAGAPELGHRKRGRPASGTFVTSDSDDHRQTKRPTKFSTQPPSLSVWSTPIPRASSIPQVKEIPTVNQGSTLDGTSSPRPFSSSDDSENTLSDIPSNQYAIGTIP
jgi:hypothetical protein